MAKVGDIYKIQLSDQRWAYGQYACRDKFGPIIRIFKQITISEIPVAEIETDQLLFRPIITGVLAAVRVGLFQKIGSSPIDKFDYPGFISTPYNEQTGNAGMWYFWNGEKSKKIGENLPKEYKEYEYLIVWSPYDVITRIETGYYPVRYRELINHNRFQPHK